MLAADTLATRQDRRESYGVKIAQRKGLLAGCTGSKVHCQRFLEWFLGGCKGQPPHMGDPEGAWGEGMIINPDDTVLMVGPSGSWVDHKLIDGFHAWGSGCEFAIGAMSFGATAEQAVAAAIKHDLGSGGEITVLRR